MTSVEASPLVYWNWSLYHNHGVRGSRLTIRKDSIIIIIIIIIRFLGPTRDKI